VVVALAVLPAVSSAGERSVAWQVDVAHTGSLRGPGLSPPFAQAWARDLPGWASYPIVAEGKVFVVVSDVTGDTPYGRDVYALDEVSGATVWVRHIEGTYWRGALAYDAGRLFVVGYDGIVYALAPADGSVLWQAALPNVHGAASAPVAANGRVLYTAAADPGSTVGALGEGDGRPLWSDTMGLGPGTPALDGDRLYVGGAAPTAQALSAGSGALIWVHAGGSSGAGVLTVAGAGRLWLWAEDSPTPGASFDLASGAPGGFSSPTAPAIDSDVVAMRSERGVWAQDAAGRHLWDVDLGRELSSPLLIANGVVLVGALDGTVVGLDMGTGKIVWSTNVGAGVTGASPSRAVNSLGGMGGGDGLLVVPAQQRLVAFRGSGSAATVPAPVDRLVGVPRRVRWRTLSRHGLAMHVRLIGAATVRARLSGRRGAHGRWALLGHSTRRVARAPGTFRVRVRAHARHRPTSARITVSIVRGAAAPVVLRATVRVVRH
jgi:outer membrane protein assembly factor BamB